MAALISIPLLIRARRRRTWRAEFASAEAEVRWFVTVLLPELMGAQSIDQLRGGWRVGEARVAAAEDRLAGLERSARDDADRERARSLREAVRSARSRIGELAASGRPGFTQELSAISYALDRAIAPTPPAS